MNFRSFVPNANARRGHWPRWTAGCVARTAQQPSGPPYRPGAATRGRAHGAAAAAGQALEQRLRAKLADWRGLLTRNVASGREVLRALLIGPLRFTPVLEERRRGYAFTATIALDRLIAGVVELPTKMASQKELHPFPPTDPLSERSPRA